MNYQQFNKKYLSLSSFRMEKKKKKEKKLLQEVRKLPNCPAREPRSHYQTEQRYHACTFILLQPKEKKVGGRAPLNKEVSLKSGMHPGCLKTRFIPDTFP